MSGEDTKPQWNFAESPEQLPLHETSGGPDAPTSLLVHCTTCKPSLFSASSFKQIHVNCAFLYVMCCVYFVGVDLSFLGEECSVCQVT